MFSFHFEFVLYVLTLLGAILLLLSLFPVRRVINELPSGALRSGWKLLGLLILFFIAGYLGYASLAGQKVNEFADLIVPLVFFFGGVFVLLVGSLTLRTSRMIRRIALLEQQTVTDSLTGLFNRRHLDACLTMEVERARRHATPLSLLMLDIDHFKRVNDTYGHNAGDLVLQCLGKCIKQRVRDTDIVVRYGGEEFAVIAPHTSLAAAETLAERIREAVAESNFLPTCSHDTPRRITVSTGIAMLDEGIEDGRKLIECADSALLLAKQNGRNRIEIYLEQAPGPDLAGARQRAS